MAEGLLQWKSSEVEGKPFAQAFSVTNREGSRLPENPRAAELVLRPMARRDPPLLYFQRKDGTRLLCEVRTAQVRDDLGEVLDVVCALRRAAMGDGEVESPLTNPVPRRVVNAVN